jgi:adenylate kinase
VGRRSDPETGKIYHVDFFPPPEEVAARCIQRSDDTEEACKERLGYFYAVRAPLPSRPERGWSW